LEGKFRISVLVIEGEELLLELMETKVGGPSTRYEGGELLFGAGRDGG
jgi:hypothetical protein